MLRHTIVGAVVIATALSGCSSAKDKPTAEAVKGAVTSVIAAAPSNAPKAPADQAPNAVTSPKGKAKITVDGKTLSLTGPVTCFSIDGKTSMFVGTDEKTGVAIVNLIGTSKPKVDSVALSGVDGLVLVVDKAFDGTSATVAKQGGNYLVEGTGQGITKSGDSKEMDFTIDATCPAASDDDGS